MNNFTFHKAENNDIQILVNYRIEFLAEYWGEQPEQSTNELRSHLTRYFETALLNNTYVCYYAKENENIAGIGGMVLRIQPGSFKNPSGIVGYLMNMYTIPSYRKNGICSKILNLLIEDAKRIGITAFELHSTKEGEAVYQKNGFTIHTEPTYRKYI